jgi:pilus assembly protein FimV
MSLNMHSNKSPRRLAINLKALSVAVASAWFLMPGAEAAGLGKLTVLSSLGQPLRAEIEMTSVAKDEVGTLTAKLASPAAFRQANIEFNPALMSLRFAIEQRGGASVIRVSSSQPMNEPFVDMLLELNGSNSRLLREYTFLLDPADLRMAQPAQVASPISVPTPAVASAVPTAPAAPARREPALSARPVPTTPEVAPAQSYQVKKGDSLAGIAHQVKPAGVSLDQMLVALYRANPDAFIDKNMNRLRAGQVLSVPDGEAARGVAAAEAGSIVVAQTRDFNEYRNRRAGQIAAGAAKPSAESRQSATGRITSTVEEPAGAGSEAKDRLKLSKADMAGSKSTGGPAAATAEDLIAKDKALADANARVQELEKNLADLQKLLEIKNKSLAEQQQQADGAKAGATSVAAVPAAAAEAQPAAVAQPGAEQKAAESVPAEAAAAPAASPQAAATPVKRPPPPPPAPEPSLVDEVLENPLLLPGAGLLLVALGAFGIYSSRRKKKQKQFSDSILADSSLKANSLFGSTGGQSVDTNNSVFNSSFAPSASHLDTNEVDPVAEADVYIAYGRDAQAEEILKEALRTQPERNPVRLKLLEIYASRKDLRSFELLASELYGMTKGVGDEWAQAAALGLSVDPNNPLYAGGKLQDEVAAKAVALTAPTEPLAELDLDALLATTQPHSVMRDPDAAESLSVPDENQFADLSVEPAPEQPAKAAAPSTVADLDFDLGDFAKELDAPPTAAAAEPASAAVPALDFASIDFNLDPVPTAEMQAEPAPAFAAVPAMADMTLQDDAAPYSEADETAELADEPVEATAVAPQMTADTPAQAAAPVSLDFDLEGLNLDLGDASAAGEGEGADPYSAEMSTKLDLALAYREIGDTEGARELLDEVLKSGSQQQAEKAKSLLAELA